MLSNINSKRALINEFFINNNIKIDFLYNLGILNLIKIFSITISNIFIADIICIY